MIRQNKEWVNGVILLSDPRLDEYAMKCPNSTDTTTFGEIERWSSEKKEIAFIPDIYVKQNTISGMPAIAIGKDNWRDAAKNGLFNYTACKNCNELNYTDRVISSKPDCNGDCFFIEDHDKDIDRANFCYDPFNCGSCDEGGYVALSTEYGWYFNNFNCKDKLKECSEINSFSSKICNCNVEDPSSIEKLSNKLLTD